MAKNGYVYVYCSNESNIDVYFDNLQVVLTHGPILEETHYYPFGLAMAGISDKAWNKQPNNFHYNGNELQNREFSDGTGLEEYDFNARYYDQQVGRFVQMDPAGLRGGQDRLSPYQFSGNNPSTFNDPDGKCPWCLIGAIVGGVVNLGIHAFEGKIHSFGDGFAAFGIGAVAGFVAGATGGASLAATGLSGASIAGGALAGATGAATGGLIQGVGNAAYFGDPYSPRQWVTDVLIGGVTGGITGGVANWLKSKPGNMFTGDPVGRGRGIWSFNNSCIGCKIEVLPMESTGIGDNLGNNISIDRDEVMKKLLNHAFSSDHISNGIMDLGGSTDEIASKALSIIDQTKYSFIEGSNNIIVNTTGGQIFTITSFVQNGTVINGDIFMGVSNRIVKHVITLLQYPW